MSDLTERITEAIRSAPRCGPSCTRYRDNVLFLHGCRCLQLAAEAALAAVFDVPITTSKTVDLTAALAVGKAYIAERTR